MVSNRPIRSRLEIAEEGKAKMENGEGGRLGEKAAKRWRCAPKFLARLKTCSDERRESGEEGGSKWEMGEEARAGVPLGGRRVRVNVVLLAPRVSVRMMRPQRG